MSSNVSVEDFSCGHCKYGVLIRGLLTNKIECRRYPPQLVMVGQESMGFGGYKWKPAWPQLSSDSFCGEFSFSSHAQTALNFAESNAEDSSISPPRVDMEPSVQEYRGVRLDYMRISGKYMVGDKAFGDKAAAMLFIDDFLRKA